jgi:aspartyl-tRNA(Asn)/glutamyl-tRNA(Gln) amidotransferase subunit B
LEKAIEYEVRRQIELIEDGGKVVQETRLYDPDLDETRSMRSKEDANDYRYFPDPDLPPLIVTKELLDAARAALPELPAARKARYATTYGLSAVDAANIANDRDSADYFEAVIGALTPNEGKLVANWMLGDLAAALNRDELAISASPVPTAQLAGLIKRVADGTLSSKLAKEVFAALWAKEGASADEIIDKRGLKQISDAGAIERLVDEALSKSAAQIADYKAGKEKALMSIVGLVMKGSGGKANPQQVLELLKKKI